MLELYSALAKFQAEVKNAPKDCKNPHFGSRYASLGSVIDTVRPALHRQGLVYLQTIRGAGLETRLVHVATGQELVDTTPLLLSKQDPQALGSALTYARRYGLSTICGIVSEDDDDGNAAIDKPAPKPVVTANKPAKATVVADAKIEAADPKEEAKAKAMSDNIKKSLTGILDFKGKVEVKP